MRNISATIQDRGMVLVDHLLKTIRAICESLECCLSVVQWRWCQLWDTFFSHLFPLHCWSVPLWCQFSMYMFSDVFHSFCNHNIAFICFFL